MKHRWTIFCVAACGLAVCLAASSSAQTVLYSDSFDRVTGSGDPNGKPAEPDNFSAWGDNDNASGGTLTNTWLVGPSRGGGANQVTDGQLASTIEGSARYPVDVTSLAPNGFTVQFDFNRFSPFNPPDPFGENNGFVSVGLGAGDDANQGGGQFNVNNADFAILFQQPIGANAGNTQFFEDGVFLPGTTEEGPVDYGDPLATHTVTLTLVPATAGQYGDTDVINGSVAVDSGTPFDFTVLGGDDFGHLSFASNGFVHRTYDNLIVTALAVVGVPGDSDGDNDVDGADLIAIQRTDPSQIDLWQSNYGAGLAGSANLGVVPEPTAAVLLAIGLGTCVRGRVRRW